MEDIAAGTVAQLAAAAVAVTVMENALLEHVFGCLMYEQLSLRGPYQQPVRYTGHHMVVAQKL